MYFKHSGSCSHTQTSNSIPVIIKWLELHLTHTMAATVGFSRQTAFMMFSAPETFIFMFSINLTHFTAYLKTGKHMGSNLELSLNSVVEAAKPNLDFSQQRPFEILVWNRLKSFLRNQFPVGEEKFISFYDWSLGLLLQSYHSLL